ncbi:enoyl-CoA hydratase/isomerase family protein [Microbacterium sp. zg.Y909]|uniref:enoyl-CoA hydratase/isomerase family protein n=1 Tax=Microbacterium sp. zg.Y909 TaxID=2969413 RepID=UPI00214CCB85|nr:enoyl-CoA hydratase/isomerase family protein [Microbacterium sp. zg.Y909]MCR2824098.1 enoyl-CoA hydratase/isomerase family protein [Microbacterium sp. zg.Y909]
MTVQASEEVGVFRAEPIAAGVGVIEIRRGAETYLTVHVLRALLRELAALDADPDCGAVVVRSEGKHFCAGRDWRVARDPADTAAAIYETAPGFLALTKPWIAELTGGSIGVGMGLALCADYRVAADSAYLWPKFVAIGIHHGFGLTATLPWLVGNQRATEMLSLGRRISMPEASATGLVDRVVPATDVRGAAEDFAAELAGQPRAALQAIKRTMRAGLRESFVQAIRHEQAVQRSLYESADFQRETGGGYRYRPEQ